MWTLFYLTPWTIPSCVFEMATQELRMIDFTPEAYR